MINVTATANGNTTRFTLPCNPYDIEDHLGILGLGMTAREIPIKGNEDVTIHMDATNDLGTQVLKTAAKHTQSPPALSTMNEFCQYLSRIYPYETYMGLPEYLERNNPETLLDLRLMSQDYLNANSPWLFNVTLQAGNRQKLLKMPCSGRQLWTALFDMGAPTQNHILVESVEFVYDEDINAGSVTWPTSPVALNQLATQLQQHLGLERKANMILALFEAKKPVGADAVLELCETWNQYRLLADEKGALMDIGKAALEQHGGDSNDFTDEDIKRAGRAYLKGHDGKKTSFGLLVRAEDLPHEAVRKKPFLELVFQTPQDDYDSVVLPMKGDALENYRFDDGSKIDLEHEHIYTYHCSHEQLEPFFECEPNIRAMNSVMQYLSGMDARHFDKLLDSCSQTQERGAMVLLDAAKTAEQEQSQAAGGMDLT